MSDLTRDADLFRGEWWPEENVVEELFQAGRRLSAALDAAEKRSDEYRIEADGLLRDVDAIELEAGLLQEKTEKERDEARKYHTAETRDRKAAEARVAALEKALTEIAKGAPNNYHAERSIHIAREALAGSPPPVTPMVRQHEDDGA